MDLGRSLVCPSSLYSLFSSSFLPSLHLPPFSPTFLPFSSALLLFLLPSYSYVPLLFPSCSPAPLLFSCFPPVLLCSLPVLLLPSCSPVSLLFSSAPPLFSCSPPVLLLPSCSPAPFLFSCSPPVSASLLFCFPSLLCPSLVPCSPSLPLLLSSLLLSSYPLLVYPPPLLPPFLFFNFCIITL